MAAFRFSGTALGPTLALVLAASCPVLVPDAAVAAAACTHPGTAGPDVLVGGSGDDVLCGRRSDDRLEGAAGDDVLRGGLGDDELFGGPDHDRLAGQPGDDEFWGEAGRDWVNALDDASFTDVIDCGAGNDRVHANVEDVVAANCERVTLYNSPIALDDTYAAVEDTDLTLPRTGPGSPAENDTDADGDTLTVASVSNSVGGTVSLNGGSIVFVPASNLCGVGAGAFDYQVRDARRLTDAGRVTVDIACVDDPAAAVDDVATVSEDSGATAVAVLANDTDPEGDAKSITTVSQPTHGTAAITGGGSGLTYEPATDYCNDPPGTSPDTFTYTLDGGSSATVSMTVTCVNDPPVVADETFDGDAAAIGNTGLFVGTNRPSHQAGKAIAGSVLDNDTDPDSPSSSLVTEPVTGAATALGGTITMKEDGTFTYHPDDGDIDATDTFTYRVCDSSPCAAGTDGSATGTLSLSIAGQVWYVRNDEAAGGDGTSDNPFDTLAEAETASGAGDTVYVFDGDDSATGLSTGYQLDDGERLIGEHAGVSLDVDGGGPLVSHTLHPGTPGARPTLAATDEDVVTLASGNVVRGLQLDKAGAGGGIAGGAGDSGGTIDQVRIIDTGAAGGQPDLELDGTTGTFAVSDLVVDNSAAASGSPGVRLNNAGTVTFAPGGAISIRTHGGPGLDVAGTDLGADSVFDQVHVTGSTAGALRLVNVTGTTTLGDGLGTDLDLTTSSGSTGAFVLADAGSVAVPSAGTATVSATGGPAVDVTGTNTPSLSFDAVSSTSSAGDGINLSGLGGGSFTATGGALTGAAGIGFDLDGGSGIVSYAGNLGDGSGLTAEVTGRTGGAVTLSGTIADGADTGGGISLSGNSGGQTTFSGSSKVLDTGAAPAVSMTASDGHTLAFTGGGLDIDTTSGAGLEAVSSGVLSVQGAGNTVDSGLGRAVRLQDTDIAAAGVTLQRVSADGAPNGIVLNNTGAAGGLTVTGAGGSCATTGDACSGGTIRSTSGDAISLTSTRAIELTRMKVVDNLGNGIRGSGVTNFSLRDSVVHNNADDAAADEAGLHFTNLTGVADITRSVVSGSLEDNARIINTSGTLSQLDVTDSTFRDTDAASPGNNGLLLQADGGSITADVLGSTFSDNRANGLQVVTNGTGSMDVEVDDSPANQSQLDDNNVGVNLAHNSSGSFTYAVRDLTIDGLDVAPGTGGSASPINVNLASQATTPMVGTVSGNTLTNSNSTTGPGIRVIGNGSATLTALIQGNTISQVANRGIEVLARDGSNRVNVTIADNTVTLAHALAADAIRVDAGSLGTDTTTVCADIRGNQATTTAAGLFGVRVRQRFAGTSYILEDYAGAATDDAAVMTFLSGTNNGATTSADHGGGGFTSTTECPMP